jgi:hypothetical protein
VVLKDGVFKKLFQVADLAGMNRKERQDYEESLKHYRDVKNSNDAARKDGEIKKEVEIVIRNYKKGRDNAFIEDIIGLTEKEIIQIIQDYQDGLYPNL